MLQVNLIYRAAWMIDLEISISILELALIVSRSRVLAVIPSSFIIRSRNSEVVYPWGLQ